MENTLIAILLILGVGVGGIWLQIFLSKKENKWAGLILPAIPLAISLIAVLNIAAFNTSNGTLQLSDENGVIIQETEIVALNTTQDMPSLIFTIVSVFLLYNIPTIVLLAIYAAYRGKRKKQRDLDKMSIQDLA